jgi:hypothetical protein
MKLRQAKKIVWCYWNGDRRVPFSTVWKAIAVVDNHIGSWWLWCLEEMDRLGMDFFDS